MRRLSFLEKRIEESIESNSLVEGGLGTCRPPLFIFACFILENS